MQKYISLLFGFFLIFSILGCNNRFESKYSAFNTSNDKTHSEEDISEYDIRKPYHLDSGDRIRVLVFGQPALSQVYELDRSGHISMPLINRVRLKNATTTQAAARIRAKLRKDIIKSPDVSVEISTYRPFFILGEVNRGGLFAYVNGMTVKMAVAMAGGYGPRANRKKFEISRHIRDKDVIRFQVSSSYRPRPGDTIQVMERYF